MKSAGTMQAVMTVVLALTICQPGLLTDQSLLTQLVDMCNDRQVALFVDAHPHQGHIDTDRILDCLDGKVMFVYYKIHASDNTSSLGQQMVQLYSQKRVTFFLMLTYRATKLLQAADRAFTEDSVGSLFPHKIKVVVMTPDKNLGQVGADLGRSVLDNVCVLTFTETVFQSHAMYTLRWRKEKARELEQIELSGIGSLCTFVFPNIQLGLNARVMKVVARPWLEEVYIDDSSGTPKYDGQAVEIVEVLAESLNFTIDFIPGPGEEPLISWEELLSRIQLGLVDFGVPLWGSSGTQYNNYSVSFPIQFDCITGAYVDTEKFKTSLLEPFSVMTDTFLATILATLVGTVLLYLLQYYSIEQKFPAALEKTLPSLIKYKDESGNDVYVDSMSIQGLSERIPNFTESDRCEDFNDEMNNDDEPQRFKFDFNDPSHIPGDNDSGIEVTSQVSDRDAMDFRRPYLEDLTNENSSQDSRWSVCKSGNSSTMSFVMGTVFDFLGSLLSQSTLPLAQSMSMRLLLWSWSLTVVTLSAVFTGTLTADLIDTTYNPPINAVEDVLKKPGFVWITPNNSVVFKILELSGEGSTSHQLYDGMIASIKKDPSLVQEYDWIQVTLDKMNDGNLMLLLDSSTLDSLRKSENMSNMVIVKKCFLERYFGIIMPKGSELEPLISEVIQRMLESGIGNYIERNYFQLAREDTDVQKDSKRSLTLKDMTVSFIALLSGLALSVAALAIEIFIKKIGTLWSWLNTLSSFCRPLRNKSNASQVSSTDNGLSTLSAPTKEDLRSRPTCSYYSNPAFTPDLWGGCGSDVIVRESCTRVMSLSLARRRSTSDVSKMSTVAKYIAKSKSLD